MEPKKKLVPNDYITIVVKGIKFESKDQKIIITSYLEDVPNEDEIKKYFNEKFDSEKIEEIKNEIDENSENEDDNKNYKNDNYMDL